MPYGLSPSNNAGVVEDAQFKAIPGFFTKINADTDLSTVMHLGDIHSGSEPCTEAFNRSVAAQMATLKFPIIYTPGDNEWSDGAHNIFPHRWQSDQRLAHGTLASIGF
jgi:hypothetical protein